MPFRLVVEEEEEEEQEQDRDRESSQERQRQQHHQPQQRQRNPRRQQYLHVYDFPPHRVSRLLESGEWLITNENVTFVSCSAGPDDSPDGDAAGDEGDEHQRRRRPTYNERGFRSITR